MSPTRFPKMNKDPVAPPVPARPSAAVVAATSTVKPADKYIAVTFYHHRFLSSYGPSTAPVKAFPESELRFFSRKDIEEFYQKHFATKSSDTIKDAKIEVSNRPLTPGYTNDSLPHTAILATDLHPRMKNAQAWFILASYDGSTHKSPADVHTQELQRLIFGLRRDLENEKLANAALIKEVKHRAARKAEKIAVAKVEELAQAQLVPLKSSLMEIVQAQLVPLKSSLMEIVQAEFVSLKPSLMESVIKHLDEVFDKKASKKKTSAEKIESASSSSVSASSDTCSMSFKLADVGVYPLTDGSGLARVVGKLPAHVGAMLLALDKLPEIKNINGSVATVKNTGFCLELVAQIKFSQWSNEWLCSWGDNVKVAPKFAVESKCPQPSLITTLSEVQPKSETVTETRSTSSRPKCPVYTSTCAVPLAGRLSKTSPTNPPRAFPAPVAAPLCKVPLSRPSPAAASPRIGCFKDVPPGLSGATEEIPWTVKVDTPSAKPDPHPVSDSDAFACDYCLESIDDARFHCQSCVDFDVCSSCYSSRAKSHAQKHDFVQLDVKTGIPIETETSSSSGSSGDISTSSVRFPILNSASSSATVAGVNNNTSNETRGAGEGSSRSSARSGQSSLSSRSHSQSSFADVTVDDLLSDIGSYEHVNSDYPDYSDFEEHF